MRRGSATSTSQGNPTPVATGGMGVMAGRATDDWAMGDGAIHDRVPGLRWSRGDPAGKKAAVTAAGGVVLNSAAVTVE